MEKQRGVLLGGGRFARPERIGNTVLRVPGPARRNVHGLLSHLAEKGITEVPRVLGMADDGRERLTFMEGTPGVPPYDSVIRSEQVLINVARLIRRIHDAAADFIAAEPWPGPQLTAAQPSTFDCVGHGDLAPWNMLFAGHAVTGLIDWDTAGPTSRAWDLAYAAYHFVPMHPTSTLSAWGWDAEPNRRARLRTFAEVYGSGVDPAELIDLAIVRLVAIAAHQEAEIRAGNPDYDVHRREGHAAAYRAGANFVIQQRSRWL